MAEKHFIIERVLVMDGDVEVRDARSLRESVRAHDAQEAVERHVMGMRAELIGISVDSANERASAIIQAGDRIYRVFAFAD